MKLRDKETGKLAFANKFNIHGLGEVVVCFDDPPDMGSDYLKNYDCWLEQKQEWKDLNQAFKDHDVIIDNYNTYFHEPATEEDRERGYSL